MKHPQLNRKLISPSYDFPVKAIQIGEGNFIRSFVDWMIHRCNKEGLFQGSVVVTQPREQGGSNLQKLKDQDGLFTIIFKGIKDDQESVRTEVVSSISKAIDPYLEWNSFLSLAENPTIEFIFSNTTEAGIKYSYEEYDFSKPIHSYPGKLTALLYRRYVRLGANKGFIILPCELLDRAGDELRSIVLKHAEDWKLGTEFTTWIYEKNYFLNSLADRIVTGFPIDEADEIQNSCGYSDSLLTVAEPYHQWVIEGSRELAKILPFEKAGLNVNWVDDLTPYVNRKVRLLNGAHSFIVPMAFLRGYDTVRDAVEDTTISRNLNLFLQDVVMPVLPFKENEIRDYIQQIIKRFRNPFIDHQLLDISLNGVSKFHARLLPTLIEYMKLKQEAPGVLLESLAYFIRFYRCQKIAGTWKGWRVINGDTEHYTLQDSANVLAAFATYWDEYDQKKDEYAFVRTILSSNDIWETPFMEYKDIAPYFDRLCEKVAEHLNQIVTTTDNKNRSL